MSRAYYNEFEPYAAQWLRNLIDAGLIAPGDVDERSIVDVDPHDLYGYTQCHFFAGIGVWSHALRSARWRDDREVWTGSCPCQPFSCAGKREGTADERHLWPEFYRLIRACRPDVVFGEQVASKDGLAWLDTVSADLEAANYSFGAVDTCAAGFGAPHIRQRLYFVGHIGRFRLADPATARLEGAAGCGGAGTQSVLDAAERRTAGGLAEAGLDEAYEFEWVAGPPEQSGDWSYCRISGGSRGRLRDAANGRWGDADWLYNRDDKIRPVESGTFPLAHGATARVGRLRAYGNGLVAPQAEGFIAAYMDCVDTKEAS